MTKSISVEGMFDFDIYLRVWMGGEQNNISWDQSVLFWCSGRLMLQCFIIIIIIIVGE